MPALYDCGHIIILTFVRSSNPLAYGPTAGLAPLRPAAPYASKKLGDLWPTAPEPASGAQAQRLDALGRQQSSETWTPLALGTMGAAVAGVLAVRALSG